MAGQLNLGDPKSESRAESAPVLEFKSVPDARGVGAAVESVKDKIATEEELVALANAWNDGGETQMAKDVRDENLACYGEKHGIWISYIFWSKSDNKFLVRRHKWGGARWDANRHRVAVRP
ncbi:MAG: hypothetical protein RLZZ283_189 [Candidatus Parcubacteria bacterium]|jgi:hypothetical protein